jgi:hypothetical protein
MIQDEGVFSIIPTYLGLASRGERILAFRSDDYYWRDLGKPENVRQAAEDAARSPELISGPLPRNEIPH